MAHSDWPLWISHQTPTYLPGSIHDVSRLQIAHGSLRLRIIVDSMSSAGGVADDERPPRRVVRRRPAHLDAVGQRDQRRPQGAAAGGLDVHRRVVDEVRLVHGGVARVGRVDRDRGRRGLHRAQCRAAPEMLVAAPGAELGRDPPRREVAGEAELGVLLGDRELVDRALSRQHVAEGEAVVEDAEDELQRAPRGRPLAQVDRQLPVAVADRPVLAPDGPPDGVVPARVGRRARRSRRRAPGRSGTAGPSAGVR